MSVLSALLAFALLAFAKAQDPTDNVSVWTFPYAASPFVITNPRDGLPDFSLNGTYGNANISCPTQLREECCTLCHGEECDACCNKTLGGKTRSCYGGMYCNSEVSAIHRLGKNMTNPLCPNYKGGSDGKNRTFLNRTRRNILERAVGWLAVHVPYGGCHVGNSFLETCGTDDGPQCPEYEYGGSCCSYVSMALGTPGDVQGDGKNRIPIRCESMQPGDFVARHDHGGGIGHWWMFREWAKPGVPGDMRMYQMGGGGGSANMGHAGGKFCPAGTGVTCLSCFKYPHLVNETAALDGITFSSGTDVTMKLAETDGAAEPV